MAEQFEAKPLRFEATKSSGSVSALLMKPDEAFCLLAFAHGAGADMRNPFMENMSLELAFRRIATLRYQFPYTEKKLRRPDPGPVLITTVRSAIAFAEEAGKGIPLLAGGKSMGGRMTSMAASEKALPGVRGIVFFGFPLHPSGAPSTERAQHLADVPVPMLFLQGTRDALATFSLLQPVCGALGERATLIPVGDADHSFHVPKKTGRSPAEIMKQLADAVEEWTIRLLGSR